MLSRSDISGWRMVFFIPWRGSPKSLARRISTCAGRLGGAPGSFLVIFRFGGRRWSSGDRSDRRCGRCGATGSSTTAPRFNNCAEGGSFSATVQQRPTTHCDIRRHSPPSQSTPLCVGKLELPFRVFVFQSPPCFSPCFLPVICWRRNSPKSLILHSNSPPFANSLPVFAGKAPCFPAAAFRAGIRRGRTIWPAPAFPI